MWISRNSLGLILIGVAGLRCGSAAEIPPGPIETASDAGAVVVPLATPPPYAEPWSVPDGDRIEGIHAIQDLARVNFEGAVDDTFTGLAVAGVADQVFLAAIRSGPPPDNSGLYVTTSVASGTVQLDVVPLLHKDGEVPYLVYDAGDVDADGASDLVVHMADPTDGSWEHLFVLHAPLPSSGSISDHATSDVGLHQYSALATSAPAGDVNADGIADLIGGYPAVPGRAYMFLGAPGGPTDPPTAEIQQDGAYYDQFGAAVAGVGDVSGDGIDDFAVGDYARWSDTDAFNGMVYVFEHVPTGVVGAETADVQIQGEPEQNLGTSIDGIGDVDADGYADVAIGSRTQAPYYGALEQLTAAIVLTGPLDDQVDVNDAHARLTVPDGWYAYYGTNVQGLGDLDQDGQDDYAVTIGSGSVAGDGYGAHAIVYDDPQGTVDFLSGDYGAVLYCRGVGPCTPMTVLPAGANGPELLIGDPTRNGDRGGAYIVPLFE